MAAPAPDTSPRFVVQKHGLCNFYVFDTATGVSRYPSFTRRGAQKVADRKNAEYLAEPGLAPRYWEETPAEAARYDRLHWNRDED